MKQKSDRLTMLVLCVHICILCKKSVNFCI